ncbi:hypothetical protein BDZ89DRAFT_1045394 [Hymenopellis radicata]|nr:hypothetical protein BDZ89DRAFT_1045394 [Hymenopellis radicata]
MCWGEIQIMKTIALHKCDRHGCLLTTIVAPTSFHIPLPPVLFCVAASLMARKKLYLTDEDREFARRETKSQYWERNKDKLNAKARAKYRARSDPCKVDGRTRSGRAARFETDEEQSLPSSVLTRNLRRKFLRVEARLDAHTNNSVYEWAHSLCKEVMDLGDDHEAALALLSDACHEPRTFLHRAECIEEEISKALGDGTLLEFVQSRMPRFLYAVNCVLDMSTEMVRGRFRETRANGKLFYQTSEDSLES